MKTIMRIGIVGALTAALLGCHSASTLPPITVAAAASLSDAMQEMKQQFEQQHPGSKVQFQFAGSGALLQQLDKGAPIDVLATADQSTMDKAQQKGLIAADTRFNFAANQLLLVVAKEAAVHPHTLQELASPAIKKIALGNPASVPVGSYSQAALQQAGVWDSVAHKMVFTQNVRQSLDYVVRGEVEASFVYKTDAAMQPDKLQVAMAVPTTQPIAYPIAVTQASQQAAQAQAFVQYVVSDAGQAVLAKYGFMPVKP